MGEVPMTLRSNRNLLTVLSTLILLPVAQARAQGGLDDGQAYDRYPQACLGDEQKALMESFLEPGDTLTPEQKILVDSTSAAFGIFEPVAVDGVPFQEIGPQPTPFPSVTPFPSETPFPSVASSH